MFLNKSSYRKVYCILALRIFILFKRFRIIIHRYSSKISINFSILLIDFIKIQLFQIELFISTYLSNINILYYYVIKILY